jgi:hypothetical protein
LVLIILFCCCAESESGTDDLAQSDKYAWPLAKKAETYTLFKTMARGRLEPENREREVARRRKRRNCRPHCKRARLRPGEQKQWGQQAEGRGRKLRGSQRLCPRSNRHKKDVAATVWTFLREPLRRGWGRMAREVP